MKTSRITVRENTVRLFLWRTRALVLVAGLVPAAAYRDARLAYLSQIGSYLIAAAQLNMAVGREVIQ
jgi:hypothetical protein